MRHLYNESAPASAGFRTGHPPSRRSVLEHVKAEFVDLISAKCEDLVSVSSTCTPPSTLRGLPSRTLSTRGTQTPCCLSSIDLLRWHACRSSSFLCANSACLLSTPHLALLHGSWGPDPWLFVHGSWVPIPGCFLHGFLGPIPWLFSFLFIIFQLIDLSSNSSSSSCPFFSRSH